MTIEEYKEYIADMEPEALFADGHDDAIIGFTSDSAVRVVYSADKVIENLEKQFSDDEDPHTAAQEYFDFNLAGAHVGDHTPVFVWMMEKDEDKDETLTSRES